MYYFGLNDLYTQKYEVSIIGLAARPILVIFISWRIYLIIKTVIYFFYL